MGNVEAGQQLHTQAVDLVQELVPRRLEHRHHHILEDQQEEAAHSPEFGVVIVQKQRNLERKVPDLVRVGTVGVQALDDLEEGAVEHPLE